jgi:hypothetical protein
VTTTPYVFCNPKIEETCYDEWGKAVSCSLISEGGCPCPTGQFRCDADLANGCVGYCTDVCCDLNNEYACRGSSKECVKLGDPCPCPEGKKECSPGTGVCSTVCCDEWTEVTCYGRDGMASSCAKVSLSLLQCFDVYFYFNFLNTLGSIRKKRMLAPSSSMAGPYEAALVQMVWSYVEQVSLFGCKDETKYITFYLV